MKTNTSSSSVDCKHCKKQIIVPRSKVWRTKFCSDGCRSAFKQTISDNRKRNCLVCKSEFQPRLQQILTGNGKYCSVACRNVAALPMLLSEEAKEKSKATYKKNLDLGLIVHPSGENHPRWKGGSKETIQRRIKDGRAKDSVKRYREANPEKTREWSTTRKNRKTGRLPKGTIVSKLKGQNYLCNICGISVASKYHVDHVFPLALGGKHEPSNIQILCPPCNLKKWIKLPDPIELKR